MIILMGTVMDRKGCIPILNVNVMFVTVRVTASLGVNKPLMFAFSRTGRHRSKKNTNADVTSSMNRR